MSEKEAYKIFSEMTPDVLEYVFCLAKAYVEKEGEIKRLKSKIEKAIEYIERCNFDNAEILIDMGSEYTYEDGFKENLLDILKENE